MAKFRFEDLGRKALFSCAIRIKRISFHASSREVNSA